MVDAVDAYATRVLAVAVARLRGPKARKGTRHWTSRAVGNPAQGKAATIDEFTRLDPDYVVPDTLAAEGVEAMRPVALRVARDAASDVAGRFGALVDDELLVDLVDEALEDMLSAATRHVADLRTAILDGESDGVDLNELVERIDRAGELGGNWLRLNARTIGTALAGKAALEQAMLLGVTHTQWLSRRDLKVRGSHIIADGQVRAVGDSFKIGEFTLEYPGDPSGLPETGEVVYGCRCSLTFAGPDDEFFQSFTEIVRSAVDGGDSPAVTAALRAAAVSSVVSAVTADLTEVNELASEVALPENTVGWRMLAGKVDVAAGQRLALPAGTVLGLAPPTATGGASMAVLVPAGTEVGVAGGALVLIHAATLAVLNVDTSGIRGRLT